MAKRPARRTGDRVSSGSPHSATPAPWGDLQLTLTLLAEGTLLHRVHQNKYRADQFNEGELGNARFSPIRDNQAQPIPTLYAGTTLLCALMETVFHDVPHTAGFKSLSKGKFAKQVYSTIQVETDLQLVDLSSVALRKLGVTRTQLIDTEKDQYPATRKWAAAVHSQCPQAQGLSWVSRQDDSAQAVVLFGDRIVAGNLRTNGELRSLTEDADTFDVVLALADRIGVSIVPEKS